MAVFKCKMCGGSLELETNTNIVECPYCGTKQTVPTLNDKLIHLYNRANQYRLDNEFDKAYSAYEVIASEKNDEAEAYWGMVLSEFGVEYVEDPKSKKRIPTCHRTLVKSILRNENYKLALEFADVERRVFYEDEAEVLDSLQKKILNASAKEEPYDVFICYKETDHEGNRTEDSVLAQEIYDNLTNKGYRVFFSRITLEDKLGKDYEPCIYAALTSAKVMLVVITDSDNCNAVWVKNEWKRYIDFMKTDKDKTLIPVYKNMSPYAFPDEFTKLQSQDMSKIGAIQDLVRGVEKLIGKNNNDSKSGLSEEEKKLLSAFEKTQARKRNLRKIIISSVIGAVLVGLICMLGIFVFPEIITEPLLIGVFNKTIEYSEVFLPFLAGSTMFFATVVSVIVFKKKSFKYAKFSFVFLFVCFSIWLIWEAIMFYIPTDLLWLGYAIVGFTAALYMTIDAIVNKKFPFLLLGVILSCVVLWGFEINVPERSNERDSSVKQVVIINDFINLRSNSNEYSYKVGIVNKGEIYTVLGSEIKGRSQWLRIKTGHGVEGYIIFGVDEEVYCEFLPVNE